MLLFFLFANLQISYLQAFSLDCRIIIYFIICPQLFVLYIFLYWPVRVTWLFWLSFQISFSLCLCKWGMQNINQCRLFRSGVKVTFDICRAIEITRR